MNDLQEWVLRNIPKPKKTEDDALIEAFRKALERTTPECPGDLRDEVPEEKPQVDEWW